MAYQKITTVTISLDTVGVSQASFGIPIFITDEVWFKERVRTYSSLEEVAEDVPTDSEAYQGASQAFAQEVPPSQIKIGRRDADTVTFTAAAATSVGQTYSITVNDTASVETVATFTTVTGSETAVTIVADLVSDLGSPTGVTVTDNLDGTFELAKSGTDPYAVTAVARLTYDSTTTETASDMLTEISNVDDDYYFVACNDHTDAFVMALAAAIEAVTKIYFVSLQEATNLGAYSEVATDTLSKLRQNQYQRTTGWYHDTADTTFPEMQYISVIAPDDPGKKVVGNNRVFGSSAAKNITTGLPLSTTDKTNLVAKNANFTETVGGIVITRYGFVSSGEKINEVRNRDFLEARTTETLQNLQIKKPVLPYTDSGINQVRNSLSTLYSRYQSTPNQPNILQEFDAYKITLPRRKDVSAADISNNTLNGSVKLYLAGSILIINITGVLGFDAA